MLTCYVILWWNIALYFFNLNVDKHGKMIQEAILVESHVYKLPVQNWRQCEPCTLKLALFIFKDYGPMNP